MSLGFYVDQQKCIGCRTCQVACKDRHDLQSVGPRPRRVDSYEAGSYPETGIYHTIVSCNHCEHPACVAACPTGAMFKSDDGTVQHDDTRCVVCRNCMLACPYHAPQHDEERNMIVKCDSCKALRQAGKNTTCVDACPMRAIEFGDMDELRAKHAGAVSDIPALADSAHTTPNLIMSAPDAAKKNDFRRIVL